MYGKLHKNIGFSLIIVAFFFLFEPSYALIDPLPDFIGYAILCISLINLADINERISCAFLGFRKAMIISLLRFLSLFIVNKVFGSDENTIGQLIFVFVFAFFEILVAIPAYKSLFEGLLSLATFHDGEAVFRKGNRGEKNWTEKLYALTSAFIVVKNIVCALPEFTSLQTNSSYEFVHVLRLFAIVAVLPLSVIWLINILKYFTVLRKDTRFVESISQKYIEKAEAQPEFYYSRMLCVGLYAVLTSCILTFDVYSGNINYIPDLFFFAPLILSVIFLKKYSAKWIPITVISVFGSALSVFLYIVESAFFERHFISAIKRNFEAYEHYYFMLMLYVVQAVVLLVTILLITLFLKDVLANGASTDVRKNKMAVQLKARMFIFVGLGAISVISDVWHIFALPYFKRGWIYEYSGIISTAFSIAFIVSAISLVTYSVGEVKRFYKTDI